MDGQTRTKVVLNYLRSDSERMVTSAEFMAFWKACNDDEREQFYTESLAAMATK